jgi:hypothetical protein
MLAASGVLVVIPEIAVYEVRRELIRQRDSAKAKGTAHGAFAALERLTQLRREPQFTHCAIKTEAMELAAQLWANLRNEGLGSASDDSLDADVILAAQALTFIGKGDTLTIATGNAKHFRAFGIDTLPWNAIAW